MRKVVLLMVVALAGGLLAFPAAAQSGTVVDVAVAEGNFTTLIAALEAVGLTDELRAEGPFTLFAPTDEAFAATLTALGITPDELFDDPERLRSILLYHVIEGQLSEADLMIMTTMDTAEEIPLALSSLNGALVVNGVVNVTRPDIVATNGVIHVVDQVLLPPPLVQIEPAQAVVVVDEPAVPLARLRVAHLTADMPAVDIFIDGKRSDIAALESGEVSTWAQFPAGPYQIALVPQGALIEEAVFGPLDVELGEGTWTTLAAIGSQSANSMRVALLPETIDAPMPVGNARVTFFHAIEDAPAIDIVIGDGVTLIDNLGYTEYASIDMPVNSYDFRIVATGTTDPVLFDMPDSTLVEGSAYFFGIIGPADLPNVATSEVSASEIALLSATDEAPLASSSVVIGDADVIDSVLADGRFTIFLDAVQSAGLEESLRGEGPFTLFVPTDEAFAALPPGTLDAWLADPDAMANVLMYHVVPAQMTADDVATSTSLNTILGTPITISVVDGQPVFNGTAGLIAGDIAARNGVIYIIDSVLLPPVESMVG